MIPIDQLVHHMFRNAERVGALMQHVTDEQFGALLLQATGGVSAVRDGGASHIESSQSDLSASHQIDPSFVRDLEDSARGVPLVVASSSGVEVPPARVVSRTQG